MKRAVIVLSLAFVLLSCTLDDTTMINNSRERVEVTLRHTDPFILNPGDSVPVRTVAGMTISFAPEEWVTINRKERQSLIIFDNRESFPFTIRNFSGVPAILTINGYFMRVPKNATTANCDRREKSLSIRVPYSTSSNSLNELQNAGFLYTRYPSFTAREDRDGGHPLAVVSQFYGRHFRVSIGFLHGISAPIDLTGTDTPPEKTASP